MTLDDVDLHPVRIPMRVRFRRVWWREAILICGPAGWGEFSPFPDYPPEIASRWLAAAVEAACSPWPKPKRHQIDVNVTIPAVDPDTAAEMVRRSGCRVAKVKVAEPREDFSRDLARVAAVREALGSDGALRVDANGAWSLEEATRNLERLAEYDLEYAEQPVATLEEMAELRRRVNVPIAADESVRLGADPMSVVEAEAADVLVLKVQPLGGARRTLELAARCGVPVVVSSALETSVGLAVGLAVAAALDRLPYACGLGTAQLLAGDVTSRPLVPSRGRLEVRRPEPDRWDDWKADKETASRLFARLRRAAELLT